MFDYLVTKVRENVEKILDYRKRDPDYTLADVIMSAFAMFSLKDPSLLSFVENYPTRKENLKQIYKIEDVPSEQGFRKILDPLDPNLLINTFKGILSEEKVEKVIEGYKCLPTLGGYIAIAIDGTGTFCSDTIKCPHCLVRHIKGEEQYYHQIAGACIVHPDKSTVLPVFGEPITNQDGSM